MRKINLVFAILVTLIIIGCSSEDNTNNSNQDELIGVWNLISVENQGNDVPVFGCGTEQTLTYSNNNRGEEYFPQDYNANLCEYSTIGFDWNRNGNLITRDVDFEEGTNIAEIIILNENQLQTVIIERNGNAVPENEQEIFKFEK